MCLPILGPAADLRLRPDRVSRTPDGWPAPCKEPPSRRGMAPQSLRPGRQQERTHPMRSILWSSFATVLLAAGPAFAGGGSAGDVELGIYGGFDIPDDYGNTHPKNGALYGGRLGYFFTPNWSIEASGQRFTTKTEFDTFPGVPDIDIHIDSFRGNLFYN